MIACLVPTFGDLVAVLSLVAVLAATGYGFYDNLRPPGARTVKPPPCSLRILRPGPYDWSRELREERRAETKGTPPGRTSRG